MDILELCSMPMNTQAGSFAWRYTGESNFQHLALQLDTVLSNNQCFFTIQLSNTYLSFTLEDMPKLAVQQIVPIF